MLASSPVIALIATTQPAKARAFYEKALKLKFVEDSPYALVFKVGGTMLRIQKVEAFTPHPFTALGFTVKDIAAELRDLKKRKVRAERYPFLEHDKAGVWSSPDGAKVAWFKDPDGNTLSLTQFA